MSRIKKALDVMEVPALFKQPLLVSSRHGAPSDSTLSPFIFGYELLSCTINSSSEILLNRSSFIIYCKDFIRYPRQIIFHKN